MSPASPAASAISCLISDELTQFDLDSAGTDSEVADTEIMAGMCDTLPALDAGRYLVRFSSRANG